MIGTTVYKILYIIVRAVMFLWHPVLKVYGKENLPKNGKVLICPNHSGMADPIWIVLAGHPDRIPRIMAKKELMKVPLLRGLLKWLGVFGVDRSGADINAVKTGLKCLKNDQQLMIFPEGTRVKRGERVQPKGGAILLSSRTGAPIVPVYLTAKRYPFSPLSCVFGEPYLPVEPGSKPSEQEMQQLAQELMDRVYALEGTV